MPRKSPGYVDYFVSPYYYIEYAIAHMGALQIWLQARQDPAWAIESY